MDREKLRQISLFNVLAPKQEEAEAPAERQEYNWQTQWRNPDYWTHQSCGECESHLHPHEHLQPGYCDNCGCSHCQLDRAS